MANGILEMLLGSQAVCISRDVVLYSWQTAAAQSSDISSLEAIRASFPASGLRGARVAAGWLGQRGLLGAAERNDNTLGKEESSPRSRPPWKTWPATGHWLARLRVRHLLKPWQNSPITLATASRRGGGSRPAMEEPLRRWSKCLHYSAPAFLVYAQPKQQVIIIPGARH